MTAPKGLSQLCNVCSRPVVTRGESNGVKVKTDYGNWHVHVDHVGGRIHAVSVSSQGRIENSQIDNFVKALFDAATLECEQIREKWDSQ